MKKILLSVFFSFLLGHVTRAQVTLDSTNLPIVAVYTYLTPIPDTPKIHAFMAIVDNGYNVMNHVTDTNYAYYGHIGIEQRGSISQLWWFTQKSYGFETRDSAGNDSNAAVLGMPSESDWVLYSPFDDRTLMRNIITYDLARDMGYWAPRTKFCELLLNDLLTWNYKGVYVMMEKIKRDNDRVDIAKLDSNDNAGDSLTGGYIFAVDQNINMPDSGFTSLNQPALFYSYKYPKGTDITPQQESYLQAYVDSFETAAAAPNFADPINGYRKFIVDTTFMDFFLIQELSKSVDCYKRSAYFYKDKNSNGGKLHAGPVWDFNSAWHNTALCSAYDQYTGWAIQQSCWINSSFPVPDWWGRLFLDSVFVNAVKCRWLNWRATVLDTTNIFHKLDSMAAYVAQGQAREYTQYNFTENFSNEISSLKSWITSRIAWMDANMPGNCTGVGIEEAATLKKLFSVYPNPAKDFFTLTADADMRNAQIEISNVLGEKIYSDSFNGLLKQIYLDAPGGIYFLRVRSEEGEKVMKLVKE